MKKQIVALAFLASTALSAQLFSPNGAPSTSNINTGNVGIGTSNPQKKLEVNGDASFWDIVSSGSNSWIFHTPDDGRKSLFIAPFGTNGQPDFTKETIFDEGNLGVGMIPTRKLSVKGDIYASGNSTISFQDDTRFIVTPSDIPNLYAPVSMPQYGFSAPNVSNSAELWISGNQGVRIFTGGNPVPKLYINTGGNASLQGKFEAKEIKVTLTPTADFVFEESYNLPKLEDVEKHIKEKKHLPEIASAKQMEKEGVNVGEFQIKLLQKIEELTLYTIEQNKLIKEQQKRIEILEDQHK